MKKLLWIIMIFALFTSLKVFAKSKNCGFTANSFLTRGDMVDIKSMGGGIVRIGFARMPLINLESPYAINEESVKRLDFLLDNAESVGLKVIIDPHTVPGQKSLFTMSPRDEFWKSQEAQNALVNLWSSLAKRYAGRGPVIYGFDILNEPAAANVIGDEGWDVWNKLIVRIVAEIRRFDKEHSIIIEPIWGELPNKEIVDRIKGVAYLDLPKDANLIVSPHVYVPQLFTHKSYKNYSASYPGVVDGVLWDKSTLKEYLRVVRDFQEKTKVRIYIGEFGAINRTGLQGNQYVKDLGKIFADYNWDWTYHGYNVGEDWMIGPKVDCDVQGKDSRYCALKEMIISDCE